MISLGQRSHYFSKAKAFFGTGQRAQSEREEMEESAKRECVYPASEGQASARR